MADYSAQIEDLGVRRNGASSWKVNPASARIAPIAFADVFSVRLPPHVMYNPDTTLMKL